MENIENTCLFSLEALIFRVVKRFLSSRLVCVLALALVSASPRVSATAVMEWNTQVLNAIRSSDTAAPHATRNLAILHTAIYDAVNSIMGGRTEYTVGTGAPAGASANAAVAAAANTVLGQLYPSLDFSGVYSSQLAGIADGQSKNDGINWGNQIATTILNMRAGDGSASANSSYTITSAMGHWQPTPHSNPSLNFNPNPELPGWGNVTPFGISSTAAQLPSAPPALNSAQYTADYNQVHSLGAAVGSSRTDDQTHAAFFWNKPNGTITTAGQWNEIAQTMASTAGLSLADEARLMAALNMSLADATIVAWEAKYEQDFWRPVTAIAYGNQDGNDDTVGDDFAGTEFGWNPLIDTPNTPESTAEESILAGAGGEVLKFYFGDEGFVYASDINGDGLITAADATYDLNNDGFITVEDAYRTFTSITEAIQEAGISRVYAGVNLGTSVAQGLEAGEDIANEVNATYFQPVVVPEPSSALLLAAASGLLLRRRRRDQR